MDEFSERMPIRMKPERQSSVSRSHGPYEEPPYAYPPTRGYLSLIIIGIIVLMGGAIIYIGSGFLDDPDDPDYDSNEKEEYYDNVRTIMSVGNLIQYIGIILLSIGLLLGAVNDDRLPINVRLGLLIAMGVIIGFKISGTYITYIGY